MRAYEWQKQVSGFPNDMKGSPLHHWDFSGIEVQLSTNFNKEKFADVSDFPVAFFQAANFYKG